MRFRKEDGEKDGVSLASRVHVGPRKYSTRVGVRTHFPQGDWGNIQTEMYTRGWFTH